MRGPTRTALELLAACVAGLLGIGVPAQRVRLSPAPPVDEVARIDAAVAPWRARLGPAGVQVGLALAEPPGRSQADTERWYRTAYALAPAVVVPVEWPRCEAQGPAACGLGGLGWLLLWDVDAPGAAALASRFGFEVVSASGRYVLLAAGRP